MLRKMILDSCGPPFALRFFLKDGEGNFWNGQTWTRNFKEARLWFDPDEATWQMHDLLLALPGELQQFMVPLFVDVKSQEPVDLIALQRWLDRSVQFFMDAQQGTGPGRSMVMIRCEWEKLKKENANGTI